MGGAKRIGAPKARAYLRSIDYGNADPTTSKGAYWVESNEGAAFFALNIDTPRRLDDLPKREQIVRAVLESMELMESE